MYILENYNEEWNIHDLAACSFLSDGRFVHALEMMGCTPLEYRDYLRIEHACNFGRKSGAKFHIQMRNIRVVRFCHPYGFSFFMAKEKSRLLDSL